MKGLSVFFSPLEHIVRVNLKPLSPRGIAIQKVSISLGSYLVSEVLTKKRGRN